MPMNLYRINAPIAPHTSTPRDRTRQDMMSALIGMVAIMLLALVIVLALAKAGHSDFVSAMGKTTIDMRASPLLGP